MKPHFTNQTGQNNSQHRQNVQASRYDDGRPLINWRAIFFRIWMFLKRKVSELWYLISQRFGIKPPSVRPRKRLLSSKWSVPIFKVAAAVTLFIYVLQRDIQFTIEMKAPLSYSSQPIAAASSQSVDQMSLVAPVSFSISSPEQETPNGVLSAATVENYIERFAGLAQEEMSKYGIPASVKMAQAILESRAGKAVAARVDNNHFGRPMTGQPFESPWRNWREHSLLVQQRYGNLLEFGDDYRAWARGLQAVGYSDRPNYANELLEVIERFHLHQLDDSTI